MNPNLPQSSKPPGGLIPTGKEAQGDERAHRPARSYRNALKPNVPRGFTLEYVPPEMDGNVPVFDFSPEDVVEGSHRWRTAAVGFVMGHKAQFGVMQRYVESRWSEFGKVEVFLIDSGWFVFRFETEEVRDRVLEMGPWTYATKPLLLKPWSPEVVMDQKSLEALPVWVRLPSLKLCFWTPLSLSRIASILGKPVCTDGLTASQARMSYARFCVEITAKSELPEVIYFRDKDGHITQQQVIYEWLPMVCETCEKLGHKTSQCVKQSLQFVAKSNEAEKGRDTGVVVQEDVGGTIVATDSKGTFEALGPEESDLDQRHFNAKEQRLDEAMGQLLCNSEMALSSNGLEVSKVVNSDLENCLSSIAPVVDTRGSVMPASVDFVKSPEKVERIGLDNSTNRTQSNSVGRTKHDLDKGRTQQNSFAILSDATQEECEDEINQTPYPTRGRGRQRGTTNARSPGPPARNTRVRKKQVNQNVNNEVSEVVTKDDPDVIAVSELTYEFVVAVSKRKRKSPWSRKEFEKKVARLKEAGADMVKIY